MTTPLRRQNATARTVRSAVPFHLVTAEVATPTSNQDILTNRSVNHLVSSALLRPPTFALQHSVAVAPPFFAPQRNEQRWFSDPAFETIFDDQSSIINLP